MLEEHDRIAEPDGGAQGPSRVEHRAGRHDREARGPQQVALDALRVLGARERLVDDVPEPGRPDDPPRDWLPLFDAALQRLPAKYRDPVVLCELQGLSRRDASAQPVRPAGVCGCHAIKKS